MYDAKNYYTNMVEVAQKDPDILGLVLDGSRGKGFATPFSDYDVSLIVRDAAIRRVETRFQDCPADVELFVYTLNTFAKLAAWDSEEVWHRYNYTHLTAQVDKLNGRIQTLIDEKGCIPSDKVAGVINRSLDHYINQTYRSLTCLRNEDKIGYHFEASEAVRPLLTALFALHDGRLLPYYKYLRWELVIFPLDQWPWDADDFLQILQQILATGDYQAQQQLLREAESLFRSNGYGQVFDDWQGQDQWAMTFRPNNEL
ncbi:MAG: aminoglycoside 6-adenylyltransferase [Chloroflexota bacterium]